MPESNRHLAEILESFTDAFYSLDRNWRFTYVNDQALDIIRKSRSELLGSSFWDGLPENLRVQIEPEFFRAVEQQSAVSFEVIDPDTHHWFDVRAYPGPAGLFVHIRNISDQRRAQQRTQQLLDMGNSLGLTITLDDVGSVILPEVISIFQAEMALLVIVEPDSTNLRLVQATGVPEDVMARWREYPQDVVSPMTCAIRSRRIVSFYSRQEISSAYAALGRAVPAASDHTLVAVPLMIGGRCIGGISLLCPSSRCQGSEDETFLWAIAGQCALALERARLYDEARGQAEERQKAQDNLRVRDRAIAAASDGILICDAAQHDLPILYSNPAFTHITGYTADEVIGRNCRFLQGDDTDPNQVSAIRTCLRENIECRVVVLNYKKDGTPFWNELKISPVRDHDGSVSHYIGVLTDVTQRIEDDKQRELALREAQERADRDPLTGLLNHRSYLKRLQDEASAAEQAGTVIAVVVLDLDNFRFFNDAYGHSTGDEVLVTVAERLINARRYDVIARYGGDEFAVLIKDIGQQTRRDIQDLVLQDLADLGYTPPGSEGTIPITVSCGIAIYPMGPKDRETLMHLAEDRLSYAKTGGHTEADDVRSSMLHAVKGFSMLDALVTAVDNKDRYTRRHSEDVLDYSLAIARELGMDQKTLDTIAVAALLHDVGKIGVPDFILRKPGRLTDEEFDAIKQHPQMGAIMVTAIPGLEDTLDAVRHHHERWDGQGYPFGLRGEEIPRIARLMAVADAYSAMTTDRPYRKGMPPAKAISILVDGAGTQWDPECVLAFTRWFGIR